MVALYSGLCCELMGLKSPRVHDVLSGDVPGDEMIAQQATVAFPKEFFRAHNRCPLTSRASKEILDAQTKFLGQHVIGIVAKGNGLKGLIR